jgi:hypothetical protein
VVGERGDDIVIKWYNVMPIQKGKTGLWLAVTDVEPRVLIRSLMFLPSIYYKEKVVRIFKHTIN